MWKETKLKGNFGQRRNSVWKYVKISAKRNQIKSKSWSKKEPNLKTCREIFVKGNLIKSESWSKKETDLKIYTGYTQLSPTSPSL